MASIRRPHSPAKHNQLLALSVSTTPPSSPLRHSSSAASSPRRHPSSLSNPYIWWRWWRRPLLRLCSFFLLGSFLGLILHLSHLPPHNNPTLLDRLSETTKSQGDQPDPSSKLLIVVTPTRPSAAQSYHLHRLAHTLRLVPPPLLWLVVDEAKSSSSSSFETTADLLRRSSVMYRHIITDRIANSSDAEAAARQRNAALELIEIHRLDGIVYFADDHNVYSLDLFHRLREIK